jgi:hypothetical protein
MAADAVETEPPLNVPAETAAGCRLYHTILQYHVEGVFAAKFWRPVIFKIGFVIRSRIATPFEQ